MSLLKEALAEKKELEARLAKLNKVIELLGGEVNQGKQRKHSPATRKKMKLAWARRKAAAPSSETETKNV